MIRTLIEVTGETSWDYQRDLASALDKLGFQPKDDADHVRFMSDLWKALDSRGWVAADLVENYRAQMKEVMSK
jgi:hypothetical protein